jgi:cytochrome c oxidase cbb3-type subunit 3
MAEYKDELLDHDYDGIQEMDNDLPRWWVWLFIISIIWGILYFLYFDVLGIGFSSTDAYRLEMDPGYVRGPGVEATYLGVIPKYRSPLALTSEDVARVQAARSSAGVAVMMSHATDTTTYVALTSAADIASGQQVYMANCASCHGNFGEGGVGPNMTDVYWIHGGEFSDIVRSVRYGYPTKGMISWLGTIPEDDILRAASFLLTLKGTNPSNAKGPEGDLVSN